MSEPNQAQVEAAALLASFKKFKNVFHHACSSDARLEYLDTGENATRKAWDKANEAEETFVAALAAATQPPSSSKE